VVNVGSIGETRNAYNILV